MARLIYFAIASLDGYVADTRGNFDWAMPDEEVHAFVNDFERGIGTYLYGRRLYEVMIGWETVHVTEPAVTRDFAELFQATDKIVYSRTLNAVSTAHTRIEREFDPEAVGRMKAAASRDLTVGGAELAGVALKAGLVDECHLLLSPVIIGGGKRALPEDIRVDLTLIAERRFGNGVVYLRYDVAR